MFGTAPLPLPEQVPYALGEQITFCEKFSRLHTGETSACEVKICPELRIFALGQMQVKRGDHTLTTADWVYHKGRELLLYLLCHPPRTKEQVGLALWPDASPVQVRSNFRVILHHLRLALGRPDWIVFEHGYYAFNRALPHWFDVDAFEANLCQAQALLADAYDPHVAAARPYLEEAVRLYRGEFLEELATGEWALLRRDDLQREYLGVLLALGAVWFAAGCYARAASIYRQVIVHDSYLEFAHRALMRCYVRLGERCQGLRHYQELCERTRHELGAVPDPETTALFEELCRGEEPAQGAIRGGGCRAW